ncbi:MAG: aspartate carbamoyltransferase, partial [Clostridioides difficile]
IKGHAYYETNNLDDVIGSLDVLYMTRVQQERFEDKSEYERLKNYYILNKAKLEKASKDMLVMHPLPRVNEIDIDVDSDDRAVYFKQAKYGMYVRMALIIKLLGINED